MTLTKVAPFFVANKGAQSTKVALMLSTAEQKVVVRMTGGCGAMSPSDAEGLYDLFVDALVLADFKGAILYGGTRMLNRLTSEVVPGVTEIPPRVAKRCRAVTMGVVPRTCDLAIDDQGRGIIVSQERGSDFITVVHPEQKTFIIIQNSVDVPATWDDEREECFQIIAEMREYGGFRSLLICYNGGGVTERELLQHAKNGWPVMLVADSGRITEKYCQDTDFLARHPNVRVVAKNALAISQALRFEIEIDLAVREFAS